MQQHLPTPVHLGLNSPAGSVPVGVLGWHLSDP